MYLEIFLVTIYYDPNSITGMPTLSVEKPYPIEHKRENKYSINPGIAYYYFKEHQKWGNENQLERIIS